MGAVSPELVDLQPQDAVAVRGEVTLTELPGFFAAAFVAAATAIAAADAEIAGPPFGYYPEMPGDTVVVEAGFAVSAPVAASGSTHPFVLPGGRAVRAMHIGPYETMARTYADVEAWMSDRGLRPASAMWECYLSDPDVEPDPARWRTLIVWPVR